MSRLPPLALLLCLAAAGGAEARPVERIRPLAVDLSAPVYLKAGARLCPRRGSRKACRTLTQRVRVEVVALGRGMLDPRLRVRSLAARSDIAGWVDERAVEN